MRLISQEQTQYHVRQGILYTSLRVCTSHSSPSSQKPLSHFPFPSPILSSWSVISFYVTPYVSAGFSTWLWAPGRAETSFCYFLHHLCTKQAWLLGASGGRSMPFLLTTPFLIEKRLREGVAAWSFIQKLEMGWTSCETESEPFRKQAHGDLWHQPMCALEKVMKMCEDSDRLLPLRNTPKTSVVIKIFPRAPASR